MKELSLENTASALQSETAWEQMLGIQTLSDETLAGVAGGQSACHRRDDDCGWSDGGDDDSDYGDDSDCERSRRCQRRRHCSFGLDLDLGWGC